jgi:hypothetical protein
MATATLEFLADDEKGVLALSREGCCVPCTNKLGCPISKEIQKEIKKKCIDYLLRENIASIEEINDVVDSREKIMTVDRCKMLKDNPEHCWPMTFAYGLGASHEMQFERVLALSYECGIFKKYLLNQMAWNCAAINVYRSTHKGEDPSLDEENKLAEDNSPIFRALYAIWHGITGKELSYDWAVDAVKKERARKRETAEAVFH